MADTDQPLDYAPPDPKALRHRRMLQITLIAICAIVLLITVCGVVTGKTAIRNANSVACASNLRQIGQAIELYFQDNRVYPPNLQAVLLTQAIAPEVFTCPASDDTKAQGSTPLGAPGTCSYIYVGSSLRRRTNPDAVVALEDPANHSMYGGNVLFADGHVEHVSMPYIIQILNDLQQGLNPPSATTTLTTAQAAKVYDTKWKPLMPQLKSGVWRIPTTGPTTAPTGPR